MSPMNKPAKTDKPFMRRFFREKRKILSENKAAKRELDMEIQSRLLLSEEYRRAETVLIYAARDFEIATDAVILAALANRKKVGLPVCRDDGIMTFRRIGDLSDLAVGRFGIREPRDGCEELLPDGAALCVCPALCCDMRGYRLGWGAGFYDRYLAKHDCIKAALCYSESLIPDFEVFDYDVPMDLICTEKFIRHINPVKGLR